MTESGIQSALFVAAGLTFLACTSDPRSHKPAGPPSAASKTDRDDCVDSFPPDILPVADIDDMMMVERIFMEDALPEKLSETPLYADIGAKAVHPALRHYTPEYQLWSDGADKERWVYVPECSSVDTSDVSFSTPNSSYLRGAPAPRSRLPRPRLPPPRACSPRLPGTCGE